MMKIGFIYIYAGNFAHIVVDEKSRQKYLYISRQEHNHGPTSGLTVMLDENGNPDKFSLEEIEYLKSIAINLKSYKDYTNYVNRSRRTYSDPIVGYHSVNL